MPAPKRDHLIATAQRLIAREGFKGVSVDRLLQEAGVAKMTLYKGFKTKDELILEVLRRRDSELRDWFMRSVESASDDPRERLLAGFDALEAWAARPDFNGCLFVSALSEYGDDSAPAHRAAREHKRLLLDYVVGLCRDAGLPDPETTGRDLRLLMEGATVARLTLGQTDSYQRAKAMAKSLIDKQRV